MSRNEDSMSRTNQKKIVFVDAFAGCGGLSLGLLQAGLEGKFAIEHDEFAFATLRANLLSKDSPFQFKWPRWLPREPIGIGKLLRAYKESAFSGGRRAVRRLESRFVHDPISPL